MDFNGKLKEMERYFKRTLKNRVKISKSLIISFLISGLFSGVVYSDTNIVLSGTGESAKIGPDVDEAKTQSYINTVGEKSILLAPGSKSAIPKRKLNNNKEIFNESYGNGKQISIPEDWRKYKGNVVIGHKARAFDDKYNINSNAVAVGEQAFANKESVGLGSEAIAYGQQVLAIGRKSYAEGNESISLGYQAFSIGEKAIALGAKSAAQSDFAIALGNGAEVDSGYNGSVALGSSSKVKESSTISVDNEVDRTKKTWINSTFSSKFAPANLLGVVSIGDSTTGSEKYRQIINLAPGTEDTHAVNLGQLREAMKGSLHYVSVKNPSTKEGNYDNDGAEGDYSIAIGVGASVKNENGKTNSLEQSIAIGNNSKVSNKWSTALGIGTSVKSMQSLALGYGTKIEENSATSIAIGNQNTKIINSKWGIALGNEITIENSKADDTNNNVLALGSDIKVGDNNADLIIIGHVNNKSEATTNASKSIIIGSGANIKIAQLQQNTNANAIAIGTNASAKIENSIALGSNSVASTAGDIVGFDVATGKTRVETSGAVGYGAWKSKYGALSIGNDNDTRQIIGVAAGSEDTHAVNLAQLKEVKNLIGKDSNNGTLKIGANLKNKTGVTGTPDYADTNAKSISLKDSGLNFQKGDNDNISVTVDEKGNIKHSIANTIKDITSIWGGKDESSAKITFASDDSRTNLPKNKIEFIFKDTTDSKILFTKNGIDLEKKAIINLKDAIDTNNVDKVVKGTLEESDATLKTTAINVNDLSTVLKKGYIYKAETPATTNGTTLTPHHLGSTISFVKWADTTAPATAPNTSTTVYKGDNLNTRYTYESDGNAKIEIGFKDSPTFKKVSLENSTNTFADNDLITKKYLDDELNKFKITIKAGGKETPIGKGDTLEFEKGTNITVNPKEADATSAPAAAPASTQATPTAAPAPTTTPVTVKVKHELNKNLQDITSIKSGADAKGTKISLETDKITLSVGTEKDGTVTETKYIFDKDKLDLKEKKLTGITDGEIKSDSKDAISGKQLNGLAGKLGLELDETKTKFKEPSFTALKNATGTASTTEVKTHKAAIEANIVAINRGFKVAGDVTEENSKDKTQYLGSTINIKSGDLTGNNTAFKGKNLKTEYKYEGGNGTISIGLTERPEFKTVELNSGEADAKKATILSDKDGNIIIKTQTDKTINIKGDTITGIKKIETLEFTTKGNNVLISNVATPVNDNDAVNKKYVDDKMKETNNLAKEAQAGVAGAMAMANLVQAQSFNDYRHQLSAAVGAYDGKQALAVGYSGISSNRRFVYKLSGSVDSIGKLGFGAGIGIMLGEKQEEKQNTKDLVKEVQKLKKENQEYKKDIKELKEKSKADIKRLEDKNKAIEKELMEIKVLLKKKK